MPHGTRNRANLAAWGTGTVVIDTEFDSFDDVVFDALRESGGTYSLGATLTLGSASSSYLFAVTAKSSWANVTAATWQSGGTATFASGSTLTVSSGGAIIVYKPGDYAFKVNTGSPYKVLINSPCDFEGSNAVNVNSGGKFTVLKTGDFAFKVDDTGGSTLITLNAATDVYGDTTVKSGSDWTFASGSTLALANGSSLTVPSGATLNVQAGALTGFDVLRMTGTANVTLASRSITRAAEHSPMSTAANWYADLFAPGIWDAADTTARTMVVPLHVPNGVTITAVTVYLKGAGGHVGLPATMPYISLWENAPATTATLIAGPTTDSAANAAAYDAVHAVTISGLSITSSRASKQYLLMVVSETGANSIAGLQYHGSTVTYTTTAYDED